jgi:hypothetical protein
MTLYILDTDVVSELRKRSPHPDLLDWLKQTDPQQLGIPLSVIFEIQSGIEGLRANEATGKADEIEAWLGRLLKQYGEHVINPNVDVARLQARMFSTPALKNFLWPNPNSTKPKFGIDLIIAATAVVFDGVVVTFNVSDYHEVHKYFPLPGLFNPKDSEWVIPASG